MMLTHRSMAYATTQQERKKLSHVTMRGRWLERTTHSGLKKCKIPCHSVTFHSPSAWWDGCCFAEEELVFCFKYDGYLEPADELVRFSVTFHSHPPNHGAFFLRQVRVAERAEDGRKRSEAAVRAKRVSFSS
jgi:hypothetical protein